MIGDNPRLWRGPHGAAAWGNAANTTPSPGPRRTTTRRSASTNATGLEVAASAADVTMFGLAVSTPWATSLSGKATGAAPGSTGRGFPTT